MTAAPPPLPSNRSVLVLLQLSAGDDGSAAAARLRQLYEPVLPGCVVHVRRHEPAGVALLYVTGPGMPTPGDDGTWGHPAGPERYAGGGPWVRWQVHEHGVTLTTSGNAVATLRRVVAGGITAWATRSLAAHAAVGLRPTVRRDVVADYVLLDCTIGDDDLLAGTLRLPDATVLEASAAGIRTSRWADDAQRYAPRSPTTAEALRQAALESAQVVGEVPGAALGLTSGRDSGLLAAALVRSGHRLPTFTMGWAGLPDVDGAAHRAARLGLPHRALALHDLRGGVLDGEQAMAAALTHRYRPAELLQAIATRTRWSDGSEIPRNALVGGLVAGGPPVVWLSGSGGELGRALFWHDGEPGAAARDVLIGPRTPGLAGPAAAAFAERVDAELALARSWGRTGMSGLDVLYLRSRMRNWLANPAPLTAFTGAVPGLLEPGLVRVLLDVPEQQRRSGSLFDAVTRGLLEEAAGRAIDVVRPTAPPPAPARRLRLRPHRDPLSDWPLLDRLLRHLDRHGPQTAREVMGETWWRQTRAHAPSRPYARQWLWNAVAVDALALVCDEL